MRSELYKTCTIQHVCENNEQVKRMIYSHYRCLKGSKKYASGEFSHSIYFTSRTKVLLNKTVAHAKLTKFQKFSVQLKKVKLSKCLGNSLTERKWKTLFFKNISR